MRSREFILDHSILGNVSEAPLTDYEPLGDFDKTGGFRHATDRALVTHPVTVGKLQHFFGRTPHEIRIFPVQVKGGAKWLEAGQVSPLELVKVVGTENAQRILNGHNENTVTIVFTNNIGTERVPLTSWMMAHRIGHAIRGVSSWNNAAKHFFGTINEILRDYYKLPVQGNVLNRDNAPYKALFDQIGKMRSARQKAISRPFEFFYELLAQYLNSGSVSFNPAPRQLFHRQQAWGQNRYISRIGSVEQREVQMKLETLARDMDIYFNDVMNEAEGKIYVM